LFELLLAEHELGKTMRALLGRLGKLSSGFPFCESDGGLEGVVDLAVIGVSVRQNLLVL
jgi:hypothetical protein